MNDIDVYPGTAVQGAPALAGWLTAPRTSRRERTRAPFAGMARVLPARPAPSGPADPHDRLLGLRHSG